MKLSEVTTVNGKILRQSERNLLAKLETDFNASPFDLPPLNSKSQVTNPLSGVSAETDPVTALLIRFVQVVAYSESMSYYGKRVPVSIFDRVRYLVMKTDNNAFFSILD